MSTILQAKRGAVADVHRALALALRSPAAAAKLRRVTVAPPAPTRHGQRGKPVPLTRHGKPNS